ncbi:MAG TPA: YIP1 family protein [Pyrinomonadaceae bacterium]|jgi:predicted membrane protein|nr:YIP1 family protein [Pyrinomonadaceae bacterium]
MRRLVGIAIFVVGLVLMVCGVTRLVPGVTSTGAFAMFVGLLVFGLSFIRPHEAGEGAPPPLSPAERIAGVFYEPARVFQNLRYHPRWLAAFLVIAICGISFGIPGILYNVAFTQRVTPEVIATATIDKVIESGWIPPDKAPLMREQAIEMARSPAVRVTTPLNQVGTLFIIMLIVAALYLLAVIAFGGRIDYWQALSVVTYASLPTALIQGLLSLLLLYLKSPDDLDPIKGQRGLARLDLGLLFSAAEHPYLYVAGNMIGVISLYGLWLTATGLRHTSERLSTTTAWIIALILWAIGLLLALASAAIFPSFVS